jgi:hypothetical protein
MPQNALLAEIATKGGTRANLGVDAVGNTLVTSGGVSSALNQSAAGVIKASPGRLCKITIITAGTAGSSWQFNDCTTTTAAAAANVIFEAPDTAAIGSVFTLDWPCAAGIVLSVVPTTGVCAVSFS